MTDRKLLTDAINLTMHGKYKEAEQIYKNLLENDADDYMLLSAIGLFYVSTKSYCEAKKYLKRASEINPSLGTISALGFAYYENGEFEEAAKILTDVLKYGENPDIYDKIIMSYFKLNQFKLAVKYSEIMYEKYPHETASVANMVKALTQSGKLFEAEKLCVGYLKEHNDSGALWIHLGFLKELIYSDDKQACKCFKIASDLGHFEAIYNMAVSYQKQGDYENAEINYKKMLEINPDDKEALTSYGMCLLKQKKFQEGYELYFKRDKSALDKNLNNKWMPNQAFEKTVMVISDQGYGDHINFARYLPFLKAKTEKVIVTVRKQLRELFENNYPDLKFISYEEINPEIQSIRITDLPYALGMDFNNIPSGEGYLKAPMTNIKSNKLKVGLCWEAGGAGIRTMSNRTVHVKNFEPIFNLENIQLYSFQVDDTFNGNEIYKDKMINLAKDFKSFEDTAEAVNAMDLIVTVDTSVAHLSGALGKKTLLLLPYVTDWRWFDDTKTTPWYNSVEIFKQVDPISWEKTIEDIICRINEYCL
ncbi:MAG: tetratricopeptide repeat protein [bacterium]|nr:tetratricopeptide repeat protein [bacterium]